MKKIVILQMLVISSSVFLQSCCKDKTEFYLGYYFEQDQEIKLEVNNQLIYMKSFKDDFIRDSPTFIKKVCMKSAENTVKFSVGQKDTIYILSPHVKRIMVNMDIKGNFRFSSEKDSLAWAIE